jgi:hypothetical protein
MRLFRQREARSLQSAQRAFFELHASLVARRSVHAGSEAPARSDEDVIGLFDSTARPAEGDGASSLALFREIVKDAGQSPPASTAGRADPSELLGVWQKFATLNDMLSSPATKTSECFDYYVSECHPELLKRHPHRTNSVPRQVRQALQLRLVEAWKRQEPDDLPLPAVATVARVWKEAGHFEAEQWAAMVLGLLEAIVSIPRVPQSYPTVSEYEGAIGRLDALLHDSLRAWKVFYASPSDIEAATASGGVSIDSMPIRMPQGVSEDREGPKPPRKARGIKPLAMLYPGHEPRRLDHVVVATVASYIVWLDPNLRKPPSVSSAVYQLLCTVKDAMKRSDFPWKECLGDPRLAEYTKLTQYLQSHAHLLRKPVPPRQDKTRARPDSAAESVVKVDEDSDLIAHVQRRLGDKVKRGTMLSPSEAWDEFHAVLPRMIRLAKTTKVQECKALFDRFGMVFMAHKQPNKARQVWKAMKEAKNDSLLPDVRTFTAALEGCKWARDANGIKVLWGQLVESRMPLDSYAWTQRVSGLTMSGDIDGGLRALNELANMWQDDKQRHEPYYIPPSIAPINGALAGLLRWRGLPAGQQLLVWAAGKGVNPDIYTYNLLLRPMLRTGSAGEINEIFAMMKQQGIEADAATLTIMLEGTLTGFGDQTPEEQTAAVRAIFSRMKAAGVKINTTTLGKMLHLLFKEGEKAESALKAVLAYMWDRNMELTPHMYSMLVTHYFSGREPDVPAVEALVRNRLLQNDAATDHVFWEDVVKGYAQHGIVGPAFEAFEKLERADAPVTLRTLELLLVALFRSQTEADRPKMARVVALAMRSAKRRSRDSEAVRMGHRFWKHHFWHLARDQGLLGQADFEGVLAASMADADADADE